VKGSTVVPESAWQKSSFSGGNDGNECVELASAGSEIALRESDAPAERISAAPGVLAAFIRAVKRGAPSLS
jgi:hypothetical protein